MTDKYEQLKKNMKHLTERYEQGILTGTLDGARIAISDLQDQIESLKAITELAVKGLGEIKDHKVHSYASSYQLIRMAQSTLSEIEKLQK